MNLTKAEIDVLRSVSIHRLLRIDNTGRNIKMLCPLHKERTASFMLYADGGYHCFGCNKTGKNGIDFLVALGYTFQEALEELVKEL